MAIDPTTLPPLSPDGDLLHVVIETPKGSRNKYAWDEELEIFSLKKALPAGMSFPYDFGFIPSTKAEDGDPLDVLVLMDEPAFPGCLVRARVIGVIEGEQTETGSKKPVRNDRLVAVAEAAHLWADTRNVSDLNPKLLEEVATFFTNYHALQGRKYRVLSVRGPKMATTLLRRASRAV